LASDAPGLARVTDPHLVNPRGVSYSPTGPFWFADHGDGVSDLLDGRGEPVPLVVTVPGAARPGGRPTGTVFNGGPGFVVSENGASAPARFLFATEDGGISGWTAVVDQARALPAVDNSSSGAVYLGLALAADPAGRSFLYAADFGRGTVDVFDQDFRPVVRPGAFRDPDLPGGFAPFNVRNINNLLFVTYALRDGNGRDDVAGPGNGFIDVYDTGGGLVWRFASRGALDSPWGLALAPADFGPFGGALLVGNNGDGRINAYDPWDGAFLGALAGDDGTPLANPDLWALTFGNGHMGGDADTLFFTAGEDDDGHDLFGAIQAPQRRGADTAGPGAFDPHAPGEPGDYPLPPGGGPALQVGGDDPRRATAVLLPLTESSLALIPTLSAAPQPAARAGAASARGPASAAGPAHPTVVVPVSADGQPAPTGGAHNSAAALSMFLDLSPSPDVPRERAGVESFPSEEYAEQQEGRTGEGRDLEAVPPPGRAGEVLAGAPAESGRAPADEREAGDEVAEARGGGVWTTLERLLFGAGAGLVEIRMLSAASCGQPRAPRGTSRRPLPSR
jgi:uncharacterized protein (TIGR03118 family)